MGPNPRTKKRPSSVMNEARLRKDSKGPQKEEQTEPGTSPGMLKSLSNLMFWGEKYDAQLEKVFGKLPTYLGSLIASSALFLLGITARGEWLLFAVYFMKYLQSGGSPTYKEESEQLINSLQDWFAVRFNGYFSVLFWSTLMSYVAYFGLGGFLHWFYYVRQRNNPETWKCQPNVWLSRDLELHEIKWGCISLVFGSVYSATVSTYLMNGGWSRMYFDYTENGYLWLVLQVPVVYMWNDYLTYLHHRMYHTPWLYKNFHKLHHTYKQPTAFSVTAIHPFEFVHMQTVLLTPLLVIPVYWLSYVIILMYTYYHGIIDHSGINFKRKWWQPWQPDCIFHDNHHQYFHVNFGFNMELWDKLHGTYRRKDRIYREDIFYGFGKSVNEASQDELASEMAERKSENVLAHRNNEHEFELEVTKKR